MILGGAEYLFYKALPLDVAGDGWDELVTLDAAITQAGGNTSTSALDAAWSPRISLCRCQRLPDSACRPQ